MKRSNCCKAKPNETYLEEMGICPRCKEHCIFEESAGMPKSQPTPIKFKWEGGIEHLPNTGFRTVVKCRIGDDAFEQENIYPMLLLGLVALAESLAALGIALKDSTPKT